MKDYFSNIKHINDFLKKELKDTIIIPVLTNDIALKETNDYSNFAYMSGKDYYNNATTSESDSDSVYETNLKQATDKKNKELVKSKLKHSIIKNMSYNNDIKTRQYAEYYYNKINEPDYKEDDKIVYYLDFVNEYNLLTNVIDFVVNEKLSETKSEVEQAKLAQNAAYKFKEEISKHNNDKKLLKQATVIYLGPFIFMKYNLIDILILCGIILLIIWIW